eukprot:gb/GECG01011420.1/.p1 GENE.gb/GECG01011420.1/~~gb/GECG01011420.1/.p1  ORF type:complete len:103 (+),score=8.16 gb/GECG01011420.1/:1-309(+)
MYHTRSRTATTGEYRQFRPCEFTRALTREALALDSPRCGSPVVEIVTRSGYQEIPSSEYVHVDDHGTSVGIESRLCRHLAFHHCLDGVSLSETALSQDPKTF